MWLGTRLIVATPAWAVRAGALLLGGAALLSAASTTAGEAPERARPRTRDLPVAATPLHETGRVPFSDRDWMAWVHPARCDSEGNVFLTSIAALDPRQVKKTPPPPPRQTLLRISADGKKRTAYSPASLSVLANADSFSVGATALGPTGTLYALVWAPRGDMSGTHSIVSFDESGRPKSHVEIDPDDMGVQGFEVFGSEEFLLRGIRPWEGSPRTAILPAAGGLLQDVVSLPEPGSGGGETMARLSDTVVRGGNGRIYYVPAGGEDDHVHAIAPSGLAEHAFRLAPPPRNQRLIEVKAAGHRLAFVYFEERPGTDKGRTWIDVYDVRFGERQARYGPVSGTPFCYAVVGGKDRFTVQQDAKYLVTLSAR
jgi:hypothetical protein